MGELTPTSYSTHRDSLDPDSGVSTIGAVFRSESGLKMLEGQGETGSSLGKKLTHHLSPQACPEVDEEGFTVRPDVTQKNILLVPLGAIVGTARTTVIPPTISNPLCVWVWGGGVSNVNKANPNTDTCPVGSELGKR